jgi:protein-disulfide isomerase/uncharacterized membrane protein
MRVHAGATACIILSAFGLALAAYLGFMHLGLLRGELLGGFGCSSGPGLLNCHAVTSSRWGSLFGIPLWVWGMFGYLAALNLASIAWCFPDWAGRALGALAGLAAFFVAVDAVLLAIMLTQIRYLCLFCLGTYAVNVLLLLTSRASAGIPWRRLIPEVLAAVRTFMPSTQRPLAWLFAVMLVLSAAGSYGLHAATRYVSQGDPAQMRSHLRQFVQTSPRVAVDLAGDPVMGADRPLETMVEFSDFFCPVCQRASQFNTILLAGHRNSLRFVFKHFPLDASCNGTVRRNVHPGACTVAAASECAHEQGKFWLFHDRVFEEGHEYELTQIAEDVRALGLDPERFQQCMDAGRGLEAVKRDIAEGERLGVSSTPTYFVNGIKVSGVMTPAMYDELVNILRGPDASP